MTPVAIVEATRDATSKLIDWLLRRVIHLVNGILDQLGQEMPQGTEVKAPSLEGVDLKWGRFALQLDYANLPLQEAVNLAAAMVMAQASPKTSASASGASYRLCGVQT